MRLLQNADISRVNPWGIAIMAMALVCMAFSGKIAGKIKAKDGERAKLTIRLLGLAVLAGGTLLAILG